ncbi:MAG: hypothetical protein ACRDYV_01810 [Acidimicrobiia bacterium]
MRMCNRSTIPFIVLVLGAVLPVHSPPALASDDGHCVASGELSFSPGLSTTPTSGSGTTDGYTGTTNCDGMINGFRPTGVGVRAEDILYGLDGPDTCDSGTDGTYVISFKVPTDGGVQQVTDRGVFQAGGLENGFITVTFQGERMHGTVQIVPLEGDCVTTPITRVSFRCEEFVTNE